MKSFIFSLFTTLMLLQGCRSSGPAKPTSLQLNWLHDPTFAGEYTLATNKDLQLTLREGGPNISPVSEVMSGRSTFAIVGADIFLQTIDKAPVGQDADLTCIFVDFQRNPVGWVLHPDAAAKAGLPSEVARDSAALNKWLFSKFADGTIKPGDKRGTETTSIWIQWKKIHKLSDKVTVTPVGFDAGIVLSAPMLAYPVYLNEEPFKLSEKVGKPVLVFDPVTDGVELYGNVIIATKKTAQDRAIVGTLQRSLRKAWESVRSDQASATNLVGTYYKGVSSNVLRMQIAKTIEFVFYGNNQPGQMDTSSNGKWNRTLKALQDSGVISGKLSIESLRENHLLSPE